MDFPLSQRGRKYSGFTPRTLVNKVLFGLAKVSENREIKITNQNEYT